MRTQTRGVDPQAEAEFGETFEEVVQAPRRSLREDDMQTRELSPEEKTSALMWAQEYLSRYDYLLTPEDMSKILDQVQGKIDAGGYEDFESMTEDLETWMDFEVIAMNEGPKAPTGGDEEDQGTDSGEWPPGTADILIGEGHSELTKLYPTMPDQAEWEQLVNDLTAFVQNLLATNKPEPGAVAGEGDQFESMLDQVLSYVDSLPGPEGRSLREDDMTPPPEEDLGAMMMALVEAGVCSEDEVAGMEADEIAQAYADLMGDVNPETGERAEIRGVDPERAAEGEASPGYSTDQTQMIDDALAIVIAGGEEGEDPAAKEEWVRVFMEESVMDFSSAQDLADAAEEAWMNVFGHEAPGDRG